MPPLSTRRSELTKTPTRRRLVLVGALAATAALLPALRASAGPHDEPHSGSNLTLEWFDLTKQAVAAAATGGQTEQSTQGRTWAVSWLAAARAIADGDGRDFRQAALVTALHDSLVAQVEPFAPDQVATLDDARDSSLAEIPNGSSKKRGIAAGHDEAAEVLSERAGDGLDTASVNAPWTPPAAAPGVHHPTPPFPAPNPPVVRAGLGQARSFLLASNDQFRAAPPPALDSTTYL